MSNFVTRYLQEHCPLGTGGGLYHFRDQILSGTVSSFFVFNSDVCCDFPVKEMYAFHKETGGCVILGTKVWKEEKEFGIIFLLGK